MGWGQMSPITDGPETLVYRHRIQQELLRKYKKPATGTLGNHFQFVMKLEMIDNDNDIIDLALSLRVIPLGDFTSFSRGSSIAGHDKCQLYVTCSAKHSLISIENMTPFHREGHIC